MLQYDADLEQNFEGGGFNEEFLSTLEGKLDSLMNG